MFSKRPTTHLVFFAVISTVCLAILKTNVVHTGAILWIWRDGMGIRKYDFLFMLLPFAATTCFIQMQKRLNNS